MIRSATEEDWDALEAIQLGARQWKEYCVRVIERDRLVRGFIVTQQIADNEFEVLDVIVDEGFRRRGLATALLKYVLSESPGTYFLEVRESNHNALSVYRQLGFEQIGMRRDYYSNPHEHAIVMRFLS